MMKGITSSLADLHGTWRKMSRFPGGSKLFSKFIGTMAPYTGTIDAHIRELGPGHAVVTMADRRKVRNHLSSIHAIALMNLGEVCTGTATLCALRKDQRAILVGLSIRYVKKARGLLTARSDFSLPDAVTSGANRDRHEIDVVAKITDNNGDLVAEATATWLIGTRA